MLAITVCGTQLRMSSQPRENFMRIVIKWLLMDVVKYLASVGQLFGIKSFRVHS